MMVSEPTRHNCVQVEKQDRYGRQTADTLHVCLKDLHRYKGRRVYEYNTFSTCGVTTKVANIACGFAGTTMTSQVSEIEEATTTREHRHLFILLNGKKSGDKHLREAVKHLRLACGHLTLGSGTSTFQTLWYL